MINYSFAIAIILISSIWKFYLENNKNNWYLNVVCILDNFSNSAVFGDKLYDEV